MSVVHGAAGSIGQVPYFRYLFHLTHLPLPPLRGATLERHCSLRRPSRPVTCRLATRPAQPAAHVQGATYPLPLTEDVQRWNYRWIPCVKLPRASCASVAPLHLQQDDGARVQPSSRVHAHHACAARDPFPHRGEKLHVRVDLITTTTTTADPRMSK